MKKFFGLIVLLVALAVCAAIGKKTNPADAGFFFVRCQIAERGRKHTSRKGSCLPKRAECPISEKNYDNTSKPSAAINLFSSSRNRVAHAPRDWRSLVM